MPESPFERKWNTEESPLQSLVKRSFTKNRKLSFPYSKCTSIQLPSPKSGLEFALKNSPLIPLLSWKEYMPAR